jgi:hypothetical protein
MESWSQQVFRPSVLQPLVLIACLEARETRFVASDNTGAVTILLGEVDTTWLGHLWRLTLDSIIVERVHGAPSSGLRERKKKKKKENLKKETNKERKNLRQRVRK